MVIVGKYIVAVEETDKDYKKILNIVKNKPIAPEGYYYRLNVELERELCEIPEIEPSVEDSEALRELEGVIDGES